jgi:molybdate transport system substrate-binding protein
MRPRPSLWLLPALLGIAAAADADEIKVAVATNFVAAMEALVERFEATSGHTVLVSSGSTGAHYAQIKNGAPFEAFFSADSERPRLLETEGVAVPGSRFLYAVGRVALWSARAGYVDADGAVLEAGDFRHLAIANPELAPYGAAARDVLTARGLWDGLQPRLVTGQDIGQAFSFVHTGNAELGFVAWAQIKHPRGEIVGSYWLVPESLHRPIEQEAVLLRDVPAARAARVHERPRSARDRAQLRIRALRRTTVPKRRARIKLWIRLMLPGVGPIGPGKIDLLRKIREHQSISAAAREMSMSYRRAWLLVDDLNSAFRRPVVEKWTGGRSRGGAKLTPTGEKLVASYESVVARADSANRVLLDELASIAAPIGQT